LKAIGDLENRRELISRDDKEKPWQKAKAWENRT